MWHGREGSWPKPKAMKEENEILEKTNEDTEKL